MAKENQPHYAIAIDPRLYKARSVSRPLPASEPAVSVVGFTHRYQATLAFLALWSEPLIAAAMTTFLVLAMFEMVIVSGTTIMLVVVGCATISSLLRLFARTAGQEMDPALALRPARESGIEIVHRIRTLSAKLPLWLLFGFLALAAAALAVKFISF